MVDQGQPRGGGVAGPFDHGVVLAQRGDERVGKHGVVFYEQNAQDRFPVVRMSGARGRIGWPRPVSSPDFKKFLNRPAQNSRWRLARAHARAGLAAALTSTFGTARGGRFQEPAT
ncbi:hypothetical protein [Pigmentiphaga kullae]|uniref:hypothetical protein n=1 Tax=Pigmentiphaga kullae TaxID=151784 RepID=UPI001F5E9D9F|nr:hypothetical protein [Pigmentiphaga kullae]